MYTKNMGIITEKTMCSVTMWKPWMFHMGVTTSERINWKLYFWLPLLCHYSTVKPTNKVSKDSCSISIWEFNIILLCQFYYLLFLKQYYFACFILLYKKKKKEDERRKSIWPIYD
jgi:hypothetical protein